MLGIETSCDETSAAVVAGGRDVLSNIVLSQVAQHAEFGGVMPEVAARTHLESIAAVVDRALADAGVLPGQLDLIAVTRGPGLAGCLLVGTSYAQGLGQAWNLPVTGVNHLWGHIRAAWLAVPDLELPVLALVASGAHSDLVWLDEGGFEVLGRTRDDAAGEAFDKAARMLGLGYPGGPALDRLARTGRPDAQPLPIPDLPGLEYSFSGLKTALLYRLRALPDAGPETRADLAAAFERSVVESLLLKLRAAISARRPREVIVCGGVAANSLLRRRAAEVVGADARLTIPPLSLCTDNGAMIAAAAHHAARSDPPLVDPSLGWDQVQPGA